MHISFHIDKNNFQRTILVYLNLTRQQHTQSTISFINIQLHFKIVLKGWLPFFIAPFARTKLSLLAFFVLRIENTSPVQHRLSLLSTVSFASFHTLRTFLTFSKGRAYCEARTVLTIAIARLGTTLLNNGSQEK